MPERRKRVLNEMWPMGWHFLSGDQIRKFQSTCLVSTGKNEKEMVVFDHLRETSKVGLTALEKASKLQSPTGDCNF